MAGELDFIRTNPHNNSVICNKTHTDTECLLIIVESIISNLFGYCGCILNKMNWNWLLEK